MAKVDLDVINAALIKLDVSILSSIEGKSKAAQYASTTYNDLRDVMLGSAPWNFAMSRAILPKSTDDLEWGVNNLARYVIPNDCLRVWRVFQQSRWAVEGQAIIVGSLNEEDNDRKFQSVPENLKIRYIKKVTAPGDFSPFFVEALATRLAFEWCTGLGSAAKKAEFRDEFVGKLDDAKALDGQEGVPEDIFVDSWSESRLD